MKRMTIAEWLEEGELRFGPDQFKWRFVCPSCGHVQAVEDFRPHKDRGATAETARFNCIGRYLPAGSARDAFGATGDGPCNYTAGGLFNISPLQVILPDGTTSTSFDFAPPIGVKATI